jgi:2-polyprenyl-3-methyl-5-hydroxy-6-metoxy-1,4-benzoquinol methylase
VKAHVTEFYNRTRRSASIANKLLRRGRVLELPLYWLLRTSYLAREGFENSGSYRFADHVYCNQAAGRYGIGRFLDRQLLNMPAVKSLRSRFFMARDELCRFLQERASPTANLDVLSVPCGIPRDLVTGVERFLSLGKELRGVRFHVLDLDEIVLPQARVFAQEHGVTLVTHHGDALDLAAYGGQFDFITCTGLGEFLDDHKLASLYSIFWHSLRPGGVMVTSAMRRQRFSDYLLRLAELHVYYRSAENLTVLARQAGFVRLTTSADEQGMQSFLRASK